MSTKTAFKFFTIFEVEKEQNYLRAMHQAGWKLVSISGFCLYRFQRCTPEDVLYQLDYSRDGREHKSEYVQMFNDCGWEYLQDYAGYSYFRKPASAAAEAEELFRRSESGNRILADVLSDRLPILSLLIPALLLCFLISLFL